MAQSVLERELLKIQTPPELTEHFKQNTWSGGGPSAVEQVEAKLLHETEETKRHDRETKKPAESKAIQERSLARPAGYTPDSGGSPIHAGQGNPSPSKGAIGNAIRNKKFGKGSLLGLAAMATGAPLLAMDHQKTAEEKGNGLAMVETAAKATALLMAPVLTMGGAALYEGGKAGIKTGKFLHERSRQMSRAGTASPFQNNRFMETKETFTMRQAAMAAIGQARGDLDNYMIGNEANMLHR